MFRIRIFAQYNAPDIRRELEKSREDFMNDPILLYFVSQGFGLLALLCSFKIGNWAKQNRR